MDKKEEDQRMKELKDRYIRFDWAIKRLLRQKANFGVLEGFLTVFLERRLPSWSYWRARVINCLRMTSHRVRQT